MPRELPRSFDPESTYAFLEDGGAASSFPGGDRFWRVLASGPRFPAAIGRVAEGAGWLFALYAIETDGRSWERHPNGGELLAMVTGAMDVVLDLPGGEATVALEAGRAVLVPRGVWHRQVVRSPGTYFGVTFGRGSEHRPLGKGGTPHAATRKPAAFGRKAARRGGAPKPGKVDSIDAYLAPLPAGQRAALERLRRDIRAAAPGAEESLSYGVPAFRLGGRLLVAFGAAAKHCALYPGPSPIEALAADLAAYDTGKGTIRFPEGKPLPASLVKKIVRARLAEQEGRRKAPR